METTVAIPELKKLLTIVKSNIGRSGRYTSPALSCVELEAAFGSLFITSASIDARATAMVNATTVTDGKVLLPAADLAKLLSGKGSVSFRSIDDDTVEVANGITSKLRTFPIEDFPVARATFDGPTYPLDLVALGDVVPAAGTDNTRPVLTGVLLTEAQIVATDSYRLHVANTNVNVPQPVILPAATLAQVLKHGQPASIRFADREVRIDAGTMTWTVGVIEGTYPNYANLIPKSLANTFEVNRKGALDALAHLKPMVRDHTTPVRLSFVGGSLCLHVMVPDKGQAEAFVPVVSGNVADDTETVIAFDPAYLTGCIAVGSGDTVTVSFSDAGKPALLTDASSTIRLLMPVKVS